MSDTDRCKNCGKVDGWPRWYGYKDALWCMAEETIGAWYFIREGSLTDNAQSIYTARQLERDSDFTRRDPAECERIVAEARAKAEEEKKPERNSDTFDPKCMDFETWARAAIERGMVVRLESPRWPIWYWVDGRWSDGDIRPLNSIYETSVHKMTWTAITPEQHKQETAEQSEAEKWEKHRWTVDADEDPPDTVFEYRSDLSYREYDSDGNCSQWWDTKVVSAWLDVVEGTECEITEAEARAIIKAWAADREGVDPYAEAKAAFADGELQTNVLNLRWVDFVHGEPFYAHPPECYRRKPAPAPAIKPPIGLRPRSVSEEPLAVEILEACLRYARDGRQVPPAWLREFRDINSRLKH